MNRSKRRLIIVLSVIAVLVVALYGANASWLAIPPHGTPRVIAQRGFEQHYIAGEVVADDACTARQILPPTHAFIDNTIPSIEAARRAGADVVEIDIRATKDRQFVLSHDDELTCRTDGAGRVSERLASELKVLDAGYGYTADQGKTFPLRGKGVGLIPTLAEVLHQYPEQRFLVQVKDGDRRVGDRLVAYMKSNELNSWDRLTFFGGAAPLQRLREVVPAVRTWKVRSIGQCFKEYLETGWFGHVPRICDDGIIIVSVDQAFILWGWPNRFLARMREHHTEVMLIGRVDSIRNGLFSRLDTVDELSRVPAGFDGSIWTDRIDVVGIAAHKAAACCVNNWGRL